MRRFFLMIFLSLISVWPAFGQLTGIIETAKKCTILIHAGCPVATDPHLTSNGFANMAEEVQKKLIESKSNFKTIIASTRSPRPGYSCDRPNFQEDVGAIMEIITTTKGPCIGYYSRSWKTNEFVKFQFSSEMATRTNLEYPQAGLFVTQGNICSPIAIHGLLNALAGDYGNPLLSCKEVTLTDSPKDPSQNYAGTLCEPFTRPTPANGASIYGNDSIVVYGTRAYRCETQGDRKVWTLYGPREKLGKNWKQYEAGRLEN